MCMGSWHRRPLAVGGGDRVSGKLIGHGVHFERIRRITGYLVGGLERFNDGKRAEERDRVKHASMKKN